MHSNLNPPTKPPAPAQTAMRRAFAASRRIPNAPSKDRAKRISIWAAEVKAALGKERDDAA